MDKTPKVNPEQTRQVADKDSVARIMSPEEPTIRVMSGPIGHRSSIDQTDASTGDASVASVSHITNGLHEAEASRARMIGLVYSVIGVTTLVWLPLLGGHVEGRTPILGSVLLAMVAMSLWVWYRSKDPACYTKRLFRTYGAVAVVTSITALYFLGPFSPTALAITLGISFFGQSRDKLGAWAICLSAIFLSFVLLSGVLLGLFPDVGVFQGYDAGVSAMSFMTLMVPLVLLVTLFQARWGRGAVEDAMSSAVSAVMDINLKNVQLEEAQAELARVFGDDGLAGRLTGQDVGAYRLGPLLGRGASGEVYDAVERTHGTRAAIKLLNSADAHRPEAVARFHREGELSANVHSPHVVKVFQYDQAKDGMLYIAMERLDGSDLAALLRSKGRLSVRSCRNLVRDVCRGLTAAHAVGIVHRDIKPHNIFLHRVSESKRVWKVLDFGVSKWLASNATLTQGGAIVGTPRYMSPEQARGETLDYRSDIYSMGSVLYRCLTGNPPFKMGGYEAIGAAAFRRPIRPREFVPDLDRQIEAVLALAMAPKPEDRPSTPAELQKMFSSAAEGTLDTQLWSRARQIPWRQ